MITQEEYNQVLLGNMSLDENRTLFNSNTDLPYMPTGTVVPIYPGRGSNIMIDRLLAD